MGRDKRVSKMRRCEMRLYSADQVSMYREMKILFTAARIVFSENEMIAARRNAHSPLHFSKNLHISCVD